MWEEPRQKTTPQGWAAMGILGQLKFPKPWMLATYVCGCTQ